MGLLAEIRRLLNENPFSNFFLHNRLRPPGALPEKKFVQLCIRCSRCLAVCPYGSVRRADFFGRLQIGTPFIHAEHRGCYLCMLCPAVCPTGALDNRLLEPGKVRMGVARIDERTCLNHIYAREEAASVASGTTTICNVCHNVCPLTGKAIIMRDGIIPEVTADCVGCGVCVEKCPVTPKAVWIVPQGMADGERAGIHHLRARRPAEDRLEAGGVLHGEELIEEKGRMAAEGNEPAYRFDFHILDELDEWQ
jgi:ferredoxin-type protein NapG